MEFEWDEEKNRLNQAKHFITFDEALVIFKGNVVTLIDGRFDHGKERIRSTGLLEIAETEVIITVVHTYRGQKTRIISARKANRKERALYNELVD